MANFYDIPTEKRKHSKRSNQISPKDGQSQTSIVNSAFQYDKEARIFESKFEEGKGEEQLNHDLQSFRSG